MRFPVEIWRLIFEATLSNERRGRHNLNPNSSIARLAQVNTFLKDLSYVYLYKRIYLGPTTFQCMLVETLELFSRTMTENKSLAELVEEIHTGTIGGGPGEATRLAQILHSVPNLRVFELRGWGEVQDSVLPIFDAFHRKRHLKTLILSSDRLLGSSSPPLCDVEDLFLILYHLRSLETVEIGPGTCSSTGTNHAAFYSSNTPLPNPTISSGLLSSMREIRERRQKVISGSSLQNWGSRLTEKCPTLRRLKLVSGLSSDLDLGILSSLAPNLIELDATSACLHLRDSHPRTFIAPALRVWSDQLVKLVLPEFRIKSNLIYPNNPGAHWASRFPYSEDDTIANIVVQMPRLRVLGVARGSMAPKHFARGPKTLMSLNLYIPSSLLFPNPSVHFLPELVAVLRNESNLPLLRHLCLSFERREEFNVDLMDGVLEMRGIVLYGTGEKWEVASQELCEASNSQVNP